MEFIFNKRLGAMILLLVSGKTIRRSSINKLAFFSDIACLLNTGQTISGEIYLRLQFGPVPEEISTTRGILLEAHFLIENRTEEMGNPHFSYTVDENIVNLDKVMATFNQDELNAIFSVKKLLADQTAAFLNDKSHEFEPWKSTRLTGDKFELNRVFDDEKLIHWMQSNGLVRKDLAVPEPLIA